MSVEMNDDLFEQLDSWNSTLRFTCRTTRAFRERHRGLVDIEPRSLAVLHLMMEYNVRRLRSEADLLRFLDLICADNNVVAMVRRVLHDGPLLILERQGEQVEVYLEDIVRMQGLHFTGMRRIRWRRRSQLYQYILSVMVARRTGFRYAQLEPSVDLSALEGEARAEAVRALRDARRALRHCLMKLCTTPASHA